MNEDNFREILSRPESDSLDYKMCGYDLSSPSGRNNFTLDLLAMANTPRTSSAILALGVNWTPEDGATVVGLEPQIDDAAFQNAIGDGRVSPHPRFNYFPIMYEGKKVGIIEIPLDLRGPYTMTKDFSGPPDLAAGTIYYRRGTTNRRATGDELLRIVNWFHTRTEISGHIDGRNSWRDFLHAVHGFDTARSYILVCDRPLISPNSLALSLALVPWRAVFDFDPYSETLGLLHELKGILESQRVLHRVVAGDYLVHPYPGIHWFFARGLAGAGEIEDGSHKLWLKKCKRELGNQLGSLCASISPSSAQLVILWSDPGLNRHLRTFLEEVEASFGELANSVVVCNEAAGLAGFCEELDVTCIEMSLRDVFIGLSGVLGPVTPHGGTKWIIPTASGAPLQLSDQDRLWLSEDLEIIHLDAGGNGSDEADEFRRGALISWRNLQLRHDLDRDETPHVRRQVENDLKRRGTVRVNVYHKPGAGGSTVGRRIIWDLHYDYPAAVLRKCMPRLTAERIGKVVALTESAAVILIDGGDHSERDIDDLFDILKSQQVAVVLLQVLRRFAPPVRGQRRFLVDDHLTDVEADRFRYAYSVCTVAVHTDLLALARSRSNRSAFYFGLTAFGTAFRGLATYVGVRTSGLTRLQRTIMTYLAFAYYYGQQSIPAQAFVAALGLSPGKRVDLHYAFASDAAPALELLIEVEKGEWRVSHHLVGLEILQQMLAPPSEERALVWKQGLSSLGVRFAEFARGAGPTPSARMLELVRRVYVYRDNTEVLGTERSLQRRFSQLIEDIPSVQGRTEVLRQVTVQFPEEAHFHAHLGRLLSFQKEFGRAVDEVDRAVQLQPDDHVLHHVLGTVIRHQMRELISGRRDLSLIVGMARKAQECFERTRALSSDLEHGYIGEIQMLTDVLDYAAGQAGVGVVAYVANPSHDPFLRSSLDRAEALLDGVQSLYAGEQPSRYILDCRARLERMYGDYSAALQSWDNLLARRDVAKSSVRRQIVWTILRRRESDWGMLAPKEVERVRVLLEENMEEDIRDYTSLRLWLRAIRHSDAPPSLDSVIERISYWKANCDALDAAYYLYVLHTLRAIDGSDQALADAERAREECRAVARFRRDRNRSFEWIGHGEGICRLVHQSRLGAWEDEFWTSTRLLSRVPGRVKAINAPQKGIIQVMGHFEAFFVPVKADLHAGRDENALVTCYVGFSYEGPRAWDVELVS